MTKVINAEYIDNYNIRLVFDNNKTGIVDFLPLIESDPRKILKELRDKKIFSNFTLACNTITWSNGVDIAPDYLLSLTKH